jgi:hypothetical protein
MKRSILVLAIAVTAMVVAGCSRDQAGKTAAGSGGGRVALDGKPLTVAGATFTPPSAWRDLGQSGMRVASYAYGPVAGDKDSATVAVFFFGKTQGGAVQANMDRWISQMSMPNGGDPAKEAKRTDLTVDGMPAHHLELVGTYNAGMGGGAMGGVSAPQPNTLLSAVVLEAPEGSVFFKLTGPRGTAEEMNRAFLAMVKAAKKGS